jgi:hypothetical protein
VELSERKCRREASTDVDGGIRVTSYKKAVAGFKRTVVRFEPTVPGGRIV